MMSRAALALLLTGCSYLIVDRPPRAVRASDRAPGPDCTATRTWPTIDLAVAGVAAVSGVAIATGVIHPKQDNGDGTMSELSDRDTALVAVAALVEGAFFAWSAKYGYDATAACAKLKVGR